MHIERISKWIDSLGGPLMFMPLDDTLYWMDIREKARNRLKDYDWVNRFESGSKVFFILGGEPLSTCVARSTDLSDYYFLWRWEYADEGFEIPEEISLELLSEIEPPVLFSSQQHSQNYLLCDPYNLETSFVDEAVTIKLEPLGAIYTYAYRPDSKTSFIVHAFQRMESAV